MQRTLKSQGEQAFYRENYEEAISALTQAMEIDETDYETLNLLAHSYRLNGDYDKAVEIFQKIVDTFPGTRRATDAQRYIDNGGHGFDDLEENNSTGSTDSGSSGTGSTDSGSSGTGSTDSGSTQSGTSQRSGTGGDSGEDTTSSSGTGTAEDPVEQ